MLHSLKQNPKQVFVIDALGAAVSAVMLGLVLPKYSSLVGVPVQTLTFLGSFPILFLVFDLFALKSEQKNSKRNLLCIAGLNLGYVVLSVFFLVHHSEQITAWGWLYFIAELIILGALIYLQWLLYKS